MPHDSSYANISLAAIRALDDQNFSDFEVFIPRPEGQDPVLYRRAGIGLSAPDYERMSESGVDVVQVRTDEFQKCEEMLESRLLQIVQNPLVSPRDKVQIVNGTGTAVVRDLMQGPMSSEDLSRATNITDCMIEGLLADSRVSTHLLEMAEHERTTASHMFVVSALAVLLGAEVFGSNQQAGSDSRETLWSLGLAGMLHDMGKLTIPVEVLNKSTPLTRQEIDLIQRHPIESVRLIGDDPKMTPTIRRYILQHHERVDGTGYPVGVKGEELLPGSRLLTIVDSFHAMVGRRTYRAPMRSAEANRVMATQSGRQFDPDMLGAWISLCEKHPFETSSTTVVSLCDAEDMPSTKHEHKPSPPPPKLLGQRRTRHECKNSTMVRCVYVGRLEKRTAAPEEFTALVNDISRGGLCILTAYPMYRGEVINVKVSSLGDETWVQSMVCWCRHTNPNVCKVGVQFMKRIASSDRCARAAVVPMEAVKTPVSATSVAGSSGDVAAAEPCGNHRERAFRTLAAIGSKRRPGAEAERTVVTLAMSGDTEVRLKALDVMIGMGTGLARESLVALVKDPNVEVCEKVLMGIASLRIFEAKDVLRNLLRDAPRCSSESSEKFALRVAGTLGKLGDRAGLPLVRATLKSDGPLNRVAAKVLGDIVDSKFPANREGVRQARRYLAAKRTVGAA